MAAPIQIKEDGEQNLVDSTFKTCSICVRQKSKYTCPRCNIHYCSVGCYQNKKHAGCSEAFYKDWVVEELSQSTASAEEKEKMFDILQREQETRDDLDPSSDSEDDVPDLHERLQGLDLDEQSSEVWSRLTEREKEEFSHMMNDGRLSNLVEIWTPWWKETSVKVEEIDEEQQKKDLPKILKNIPDVGELLSKSKPSSDLRFSIVNVLYAYAFVSHLHNGGHQDCPLVAAQDLLNVSEVLGKGGNSTGTVEAVHMCISSIQQGGSRWQVDSALTVKCLEDTVHLLCGRGDLDPLSYMLAALSDVTRLNRSALAECKKELSSQKSNTKELKEWKKKLFLAEKKSLFLLSWAQRYGMAVREVLQELKLELALQKTNTALVSNSKAELESEWGGKIPRKKKTLIQELT